MATHKHHLLYPRKVWEAHDSTKALRRDSSLIIPMDDEQHRALHSAIVIVPTLDRFTAWRTAKNYEGGSNPISCLFNLINAIDLSLSDERMDRIAIANGVVVMQAIEAQVNYIRDGIE